MTLKEIIEKVIAAVKKALLNDPDNAAAHGKLVKQVEDLTAEKKELETLTGPLIELIDLATAATPEGGSEEQPTTPTDGTHNVSMSAVSDGKEYLKISLVNNGVSAERAALLAKVKDGVKAAGTAQAVGGSSFGSVFNFSDNGTSDSFTFDNGNQKNAGDIAFLEAFLAEAKAALAAGSPPPP